MIRLLKKGYIFTSFQEAGQTYVAALVMDQGL